MSEGQFESDKAIYEVLPSFTAKPFAWGRYKSEGQPHYFLLSEFRDIGQQPPDPKRLTLRLAQLHRSSFSPTSKFGFHTTTCHAKLHQLTDLWEDSWETCYRKQLAHMFDLDRERLPRWPEFRAVADLVLDVCVPTLLHPLQSDGRTIKPCLVHGNIWDENTATDVETGEPFVFDGSAMYAHNEYELGNWRTPRHRLSSRSYIRNYKKYFPASEPGEFCCWFFFGCFFNDARLSHFGRRSLSLSHSFFLPHLLFFLFALFPSLHV
jgi:protein-ribulosamine 3-kinase